MEKMNVASEATEAFGSAPLDDPTAVQIRKSGETYYFSCSHILWLGLSPGSSIAPDQIIVSALSTSPDHKRWEHHSWRKHFLHGCNKSKTCEHSPAHCK